MNFNNFYQCRILYSNILHIKVHPQILVTQAISTMYPHIQADLLPWTTQDVSKQRTAFRAKQRSYAAHYGFYSVLIIFLWFTISLFGI
jgi:hypothetical protein